MDRIGQGLELSRDHVGKTHKNTKPVPSSSKAPCFYRNGIPDLEKSILCRAKHTCKCAHVYV